MIARPRAGGGAGPLWTAPGVRAERLVPPNLLWASNGIAFGPDGRLYIAQFLGATISALDVDTGELETVLGPDGPLTAPDDIAFADDGAMFVVDLPAELVWRRDPDGTMSVVAEGIVAPDGVACHRGRLFVNELAVDGRLLEIDLAGGPPRVMATGLVLGNAMQVGPDGLLYYPHLMGGEVWRVGLDGGEPERVLDDIVMPVAVRFDPSGGLRVLSARNGQLHRIDLRSGERDVRESGVIGADNVAFAPDGTAYVSGAFRGGLRALSPDGGVRVVIPEGLNGPFGIAALAGGDLLLADHFGTARLPGGTGEPVREDWLAELHEAGIRGLATAGDDVVVTTENGNVHRGSPTSGWSTTRGLDDPGGAVTTPDGRVLVAEIGGGRVVELDGDGGFRPVAEGLDRPVDLTVDDHGDVCVSVTGGGRVVRLRDGRVLTAGLSRPEGLVAAHGALWCVAAGEGRLYRIDPDTRAGSVVASGLATDVRPPHVPDRAASGVARRPRPFAAVERAGDDLVVGLGAEGSLLRLSGLAASSGSPTKGTR
ncbi:hypothetical protein EV383_2720 [Pseudonocardia sediminis]|uniref:Sugar lactone lactonase YvrE n=1 Tax=Pseudonocardia sediminis TaxID=1397368 RepID=A0A4Q7UVN7_PSEST|nr:hypothetical protein [Pseudonocardia sediminis]RZT85835.1 hypothetical protein EV383_2720 [Pseudonocardia sediminis]